MNSKFCEDADLKKLVLEREDSKLVEHTTKDNYWTDDRDGWGSNQLGKH